MKIVESKGLSYTGNMTDELIQTIETVKSLCENRNFVSNGRITREVYLNIQLGCNLNNTEIYLLTPRKQLFAYWANGCFHSNCRIGKQIQFIR